MAVTSARIVNMKEKGHFEPENERVDKYTLADELPAKISELVLRPRTMNKQLFSTRILTINDKEAVLNFLKRFFFRDEPLNQAVGLVQTPDSRCEELEDYAVSSLAENVSLGAVDEHGDLVGLILNGLAHRTDCEEPVDKSEECANPKFSKILRLLGHLEKEAKIWDKLPETCNTVLEVRIASTHTEWRGRGVMKVLCDESERLAKEIGARAMRMDATSAFSARAAEKLGYMEVYAVHYADLTFAPQPDPPHTKAKVYIKNL